MLTDTTIRVLQITNHDEQYEYTRTHAGEPVILNMRDLSSPDFIEELTNLISANGEGEDFIARCQCGETEGNNKIGSTCRECGTVVQAREMLDDDNLICKNWLSCPPELVGGWINPKIYIILSTWLSRAPSGVKRNGNYLDDILDVTTPIPADLVDVIDGKGFTYFHDNFDRLMEHFIYRDNEISKRPRTGAMKVFLQAYRDRVFCRYVPILNGAVAPLMVTGSGPSMKRYSDQTSDRVLSAAITLSRVMLDRSRKNRLHRVEADVFVAYKKIIEYFEQSTKKLLSHKRALPRMHLFGGRFHMTFRAVIVPIVGLHKIRELHVPQKLAVNTLRAHITGELFRRGLDNRQASIRLRRALQIFDPEIHQIMLDLIADSPFKGIPCLWDRPPSLRDGSVMVKFITKISTDMDDRAVGITPMDVALPNADFDGDCTLLVVF